MFYQITGTVTKTHDNGKTTHQIPTFYLNSHVQGITDADHAHKIAMEVVNPTNDKSLAVSLYVTTVYPDA